MLPLCDQVIRLIIFLLVIISMIWVTRTEDDHPDHLITSSLRLQEATEKLNSANRLWG
eukprot:COSAG03_NODE_941_length_5251_cov_254.015334_1_plen_58_part_00